MTAFDSPSPMQISFNNPIQICSMSAGKPAPRFSFALDNSHKHPLDFNYEVFHMSSTLRPYVLVRAYSVLSKNTSACGNFGPLILGCTAATPPFCQASNSLLFCFHCLWDMMLLPACWHRLERFKFSSTAVDSYMKYQSWVWKSKMLLWKGFLLRTESATPRSCTSPLTTALWPCWVAHHQI